MNHINQNDNVDNNQTQEDISTNPPDDYHINTTSSYSGPPDIEPSLEEPIFYRNFTNSGISQSRISIRPPTLNRSRNSPRISSIPRLNSTVNSLSSSGTHDDRTSYFTDRAPQQDNNNTELNPDLNMPFPDIGGNVLNMRQEIMNGSYSAISSSFINSNNSTTTTSKKSSL